MIFLATILTLSLIAALMWGLSRMTASILEMYGDAE